MYCLAKWTQRTWGIPTDWWVWVVTLRPQQREAPPNRRGPTPLRPTTLQLCPYMVAAGLMALLWPGPDTLTESYPHLTEEDMPGIQRCFFRTLDYLQQTQPHVLEQGKGTGAGRERPVLRARNGPWKEEAPVGQHHRVAGDPVGYKHRIQGQGDGVGKGVWLGPHNGPKG